MEPSYVNFVLALIAVLILLYGLLWLVKKVGLSQVTLKSPHKRLKLLEIVPLDHKRRIVLLQKDDKEYTLFVGDNSEFVIESSPAKATIKNDSPDTKKSVKSKKS